MLDELRADVDPRLIRRRKVLRTRAPTDREPVRVRAERRIGRQARLADPRLAGHQHHLTGPDRAAFRALLEQRRARMTRPTYAALGTVRSASGNGHRPISAPACSGSSGSHTTENASIGSGMPFNSSSPTDSSRAPSTRPASHPRHRRDEDPVRRRLVTQPRRLDRGHPEVVAVLDRRLAGAQADPHMQRLLRTAVAPLEQLLGQHRTATAADADENATISPSPVFLNSRPPDASIASRSSAKYSSRSSSARTGPTDVASRVDPTRSTSQIVASSTDSAKPPPRGIPGDGSLRPPRRRPGLRKAGQSPPGGEPLRRRARARTTALTAAMSETKPAPELGATRSPAGN